MPDIKTYKAVVRTLVDTPVPIGRAWCLIYPLACPHHQHDQETINLKPEMEGRKRDFVFYKNWSTGAFPCPSVYFMVLFCNILVYFS